MSVFPGLLNERISCGILIAPVEYYGGANRDALNILFIEDRSMPSRNMAGLFAEEHKLLYASA